jgi:hypothetical protein
MHFPLPPFNLVRRKTRHKLSPNWSEDAPAAEAFAPAHG